MNRFEIISYVGVGALKFGMSRIAAHKLLNEPKLSIPDEDEGLVVDYWRDNGLQLAFTTAYDQLVLISMYSNISSIILEGLELDWNSTSALFDRLLISDQSAKQMSGVTIFFKSGISTVSFKSEDLGSKSLTVFAKGQWSESDPRLKPAPKLWL